jgi:sec-independent protein translocase protein TatA
MGKFGITEIILILLVVVLLFGGRKIPELMKGIGQGMKEFKKASKVDDEAKKNENEAASAEAIEEKEEKGKK